MFTTASALSGSFPSSSFSADCRHSTSSSSSFFSSSSSTESFLVQIKMKQSILQKSSVVSRLLDTLWKRILKINENQKYFIVDSVGLKQLASGCEFISTESRDQQVFPTSACCLISASELVPPPSSKFSSLSSSSSSSSLSSLNSQQATTNEAHFGILIHDVNVIKQKGCEALCSVSFTPILVRAIGMFAQSRIDKTLVFPSCTFRRHLIDSKKFPSLSSDAAENGIGDSPVDSSCFSSSSLILSGYILPSFDQIRVLACGVEFPLVDEANKTVRSFSCSSSTSSQRDLLATQHLAFLRKWASKIVNKNRCFSSSLKTEVGTKDEDEGSTVPRWMIPSRASEVGFWCAIAYQTTFHSRDESDDDSEEEEEEEESKISSNRHHHRHHNNHFLVPSSMLLSSSADVRLGNQIPPQFKQKVQEDCFVDFLDQVVFPAKSSSNDDDDQDEINIITSDENDSGNLFFVPGSSRLIQEQNEKLFDKFNNIENQDQEVIPSASTRKKTSTEVVPTVSGKRRQRTTK